MNSFFLNLRLSHAGLAVCVNRNWTPHDSHREPRATKTHSEGMAPANSTPSPGLNIQAMSPTAPFVATTISDPLGRQRAAALCPSVNEYRTAPQLPADVVQFDPPRSAAPSQFDCDHPEDHGCPQHIPCWWKKLTTQAYLRASLGPSSTMSVKLGRHNCQPTTNLCSNVSPSINNTKPTSLTQRSMQTGMWPRPSLQRVNECILCPSSTMPNVTKTTKRNIASSPYKHNLTWMQTTKRTITIT
jgi:hypothetical protein